jgi:hypothetical protein
MKKILIDAAAFGNATARTIDFSTRDKEAYLYPNSAWKTPFIGNDYLFSPGGERMAPHVSDVRPA